MNHEVQTSNKQYSPKGLYCLFGPDCRGQGYDKA